MELPIYRSFPMPIYLDLLWWAWCKVALTRPDLESLIEREEIDSSERPILLELCRPILQQILRAKLLFDRSEADGNVFDLRRVEGATAGSDREPS